MRIVIASLFVTMSFCSTRALAIDVNGFVAGYQQKNRVVLNSFLQSYQGTAVYPYILVRLLEDSVVKQAVVTPEVATLFSQYTHSLASQKLRISYLKYWAQHRNWKDYIRYYRELDVSAVGTDPEFDCTALNYLSYRNEPIAPYLNKTVSDIDKISDSCLKTLAIALSHGADLKLVQQKTFEIASVAKASDRAILSANVQQWPEGQPKNHIKAGLSVISRARSQARDFTITPSERVFLPYTAMALTQTHQKRADAFFTEYQAYGQKTAPIALDWMARTGILAHNWKGVTQTITTMEPKQRDKPIWRYWLAYSLQKTNRASEATPILNDLSTSIDYYGWLARQQTNLSMPTKILQQDTETEKNITGALRNPKLNSIKQLNDAGLWVEAAQEMNLLYPNATPKQYWVAAKIAEHLGLIERQINYAEKSGVLDWSTRFPQPYQAIIIQAAKQSGTDAALISAVIRQESRFMPHAYSSVGASGLMQLMPSTAKSMAQQLNLKIKMSTAVLFQPEVNIKLGSAYLKVLQNKGLKKEEVIASYNAGIGRVGQWNRNTQHLTAAEWVELIPFEETRNYVKNVLSNDAYYQYTQNRQSMMPKN